MSEIKDIPKHWEIKKLGEVCGIVYGKGLPVKELKTSGFPVFGANGVIGFNDKYLFEEPQVLISCRGAASGKINLSPPKCYVTNNSLVLDIKHKNELDRNYLFYALSIAKKTKLVTGTAQPQVTINNAVELDICYPPLSEQHAIVAKIEELLSELDNGKQQLLTAQQQLKVYRQSLLKWAFEGKLSNKNVKDGELPVGWKWVKSGELFSFVTSGSRGWAKYYSDKGAIFIRITNMNFDTLELDLREKKNQYVNPPSNSEGIRTKVQEGDFLFSITGYLGMFAIAPKLENAFVNQHVCLCRPKDGFNKKYVGYWIISKSGGIHHLNKNKKGAVKAGLNLDDLKTFPVPLCSLEEQQQIVSELESKLTVCDKIEETISQSLLQAETLRQSILKKAFEGRLV